MGEDKAFLKYGNRFLYEYTLSILKKFSGNILISSINQRFNQHDYLCIKDEIPNLGPIGGIYSCLKKIKCESAIVLPCDLPLISENVLKILLKNSPGYDITVALNPQNYPEPLIGVYSTSVIPVLKKMIDSQHYKLQEALCLVNTNFVKIPGSSPEIFRNINNPEEFNTLPGEKSI